LTAIFPGNGPNITFQSSEHYSPDFFLCHQIAIDLVAEVDQKTDISYCPMLGSIYCE
jgi:hypothetical protein